MSKSVKMSDFKTGDTIDFRAYHKARVANGEVCAHCCGYIIAPGGGHERLCYECRDIAKPGELWHSSLVRCPKCGHTWNPGDCEDYKCYSDGEHKLSCVPQSGENQGRNTRPERRVTHGWTHATTIDLT